MSFDQLKYSSAVVSRKLLNQAGQQDYSPLFLLSLTFLLFLVTFFPIFNLNTTILGSSWVSTIYCPIMSFYCTCDFPFILQLPFPFIQGVFNLSIQHKPKRQEQNLHISLKFLIKLPKKVCTSLGKNCSYNLMTIFEEKKFQSNNLLH